MTRVALAFSRAAATSQAPRAALAAKTVPVAVARDDRFGGLIATVVGILLVLMIVPEGFDYESLATRGAPAFGGTASRLLWLALLGLAVLALLRRAVVTWRLMKTLNPFLLGFVVVAAASLAWSIDPSLTARRLIRVATIVAVALAFAVMAWHERRFQNVVRPVITGVLIASIAFGIGWPHLAIHSETSGVLAGAWRGLANHKNSLGDLACIGLIFWAHAGLSRETRALPALAGVMLAAACLVLSRSSTSIVATAFTLLFLVLLLRAPAGMRRFMPWIVVLFVIALLTYALVLLRILPGLYTLMTPIGAITGKDLTFTGRTGIWNIVFEHIRHQPWLGSGYGAYWGASEPGSASYEFVDKLGFDPGSAHNGYLDVLNDLGALGLMMLFAYLAVFVAQGVRLLSSARSQAALLLALFLQQAITNLAESRWFNPLSVDFAIMALATTALARTLLEQHRARAAAGTRPPSVAVPAGARIPAPHGAQP